MEQWLMVTATWLTAVGTIAVAVVAIFCKEIHERCFRPKMTLEHPGTPPDPVKCDPPRFYEHLQLRNSGRAIARNCRVMLCGIARRQFDGTFAPQLVPIPLQFTWSPSEMPPLQRDVSKSGDILDLGFVARGPTTRFQPQFYVTPAGHDYSVPPEGVVRYFLQVVADNYVSPIHVFEVARDGGWDDTKEHVTLLKEKGLPVPQENPDPKIVV